MKSCGDVHPKYLTAKRCLLGETSKRGRGVPMALDRLLLLYDIIWPGDEMYVWIDGWIRVEFSWTRGVMASIDSTLKASASLGRVALLFCELIS